MHSATPTKAGLGSVRSQRAASSAYQPVLHGCATGLAQDCHSNVLEGLTALHKDHPWGPRELQEAGREGELRHWLAPPDAEGGCIPQLRTAAGPPKAGRQGPGREAGSPCGRGQPAVTVSGERAPQPSPAPTRDCTSVCAQTRGGTPRPGRGPRPAAPPRAHLPPVVAAAVAA